MKAHAHVCPACGIDSNLRRDRANDSQAKSSAGKPFALDERAAIADVDGELSASDPGVQFDIGSRPGIPLVRVLNRVGQCFARCGRNVVDAIATQADRFEKRAQGVADRRNATRLRGTPQTKLRRGVHGFMRSFR